MAESYDPDPIVMVVVYSDGKKKDIYWSDVKEKKMSKKYPKQSNTKPEVGLAQLACCDCGLVHTMGFTVDGRDILRLGFKRDNRATAQLRRGTFAYLKKPMKRDKWKIVRND